MRHLPLILTYAALAAVFAVCLLGAYACGASAMGALYAFDAVLCLGLAALLRHLNRS